MTSAQDLLSQLNDLQAKVNQLAGGKAAPQSEQSQNQQHETYTWEQLAQAAQSGEITDVQAQQIWANQLRREAQETAREELRQSQEAERADREYRSEVGKYHEKLPELKDPESAEAKKVVSEFEKLKERSPSADDKLLGLMALSRLYGAPETIAKRSTKEPPKETHEEGASGPDDSSDEGGDSGGEEGLPSNLTKDQRRYYSDLISKGIYTAKEVHEEVKFADELQKRKARR